MHYNIYRYHHSKHQHYTVYMYTSKSVRSTDITFDLSSPPPGVQTIHFKMIRGKAREKSANDGKSWLSSPWPRKKLTPLVVCLLEYAFSHKAPQTMFFFFFLMSFPFPNTLPTSPYQPFSGLPQWLKDKGAGNGGQVGGGGKRLYVIHISNIYQTM